MRIGEAEVSADRAHVSHPYVADMTLHLGKPGPVGAHQLRALERAVCDGRADSQPAVRAQAGELRNPLDVDKRAEVREPELGHEQQLGAAGVHDGGVAQPR